MKQAQDTAEKLMVEPILVHLQNQDPLGRYSARNTEIMYGEGFAFGYSIQIYKAGKTLWRRIFPKKVVQIEQRSFHGKKSLEVKSFDSNVDTERLKAVCETVDFDGLRFAGALRASGAVDYF